MTYFNRAGWTLIFSLIEISHIHTRKRDRSDVSVNLTIAVCPFQSPVVEICIGPWRMKGRQLWEAMNRKLPNIPWSIHSPHRLLLEVPTMVRSRRARGRFGTVFIVQHHTRRADSISQTMTRRGEYSYLAGIGLEACWVLTCAQRRFVGPKNQYGSITTN